MLLLGDYVGQATVSIFDEQQPASNVFESKLFSGDTHLSQANRANLRAY